MIAEDAFRSEIRQPDNEKGNEHVNLTPRHRSTLKQQRTAPRGLDCAVLPDETRVFIEAETLDIYTRMVNAGCSLQQTLTAVFLSGMSAANAAQRDD